MAGIRTFHSYSVDVRLIFVVLVVRTCSASVALARDGPLVGNTRIRRTCMDSQEVALQVFPSMDCDRMLEA